MNELERLREENKRLREALFPHPGVEGAAPLILYFSTKADRDEFVAIIHEAKPNMRSYKI